MNKPGWYPDPKDPSGRYRYWDGASWSNQTIDEFPAPTSRSKIWTYLLSIACVITVVALIIWFILSPNSNHYQATEDQNSTRPTGQIWDEKEPTTPPSPPPNSKMKKCPEHTDTKTTANNNDGWLHGGGLKVKKIADWNHRDVNTGWILDQDTQTYNFAYDWFSMIAVGKISFADGFSTNQKIAAYQIMSCFTTSSYYLGFSGSKDIISEKLTIQGHSAYRLSAEIYVSGREEQKISGDIADVTIIDLHNKDSYGIFFSMITIGDDPNIDKLNTAAKTLSIDS